MGCAIIVASKYLLDCYFYAFKEKKHLPFKNKLRGGIRK